MVITRAPHRGFTLIELMVVVAIAAVMLGLGVPSFKDFILGQRVKTAAADFALAAIQARSEALKRSTQVGLVAAAGGWNDGWRVQATSSALGKTWADAADRITLSSQDAFQGLSIVDDGSPPNTVLLYGRDGRLKDPLNPNDPLTDATRPKMKVAAEDGTKKRCVAFELSGLPASRLADKASNKCSWE